MGWPATTCAVVVVALVACGGRAPLPPSCTAATPDDVLHALRAAPGRVALQDGTRLSTCVERAVSDAELQVVGATLTAAADRLARRLREGDEVAFELGFLMGATERGATGANGVQDELARRMGQAAGFDGGPSRRRDALLRGRAAGRQRG